MYQILDGGYTKMSKNMKSQKVPEEFDEFVKRGIINKIKIEVEDDKITKTNFLMCMVKYFKSNDKSYTDLINTRYEDGF